LKQQPRPSQVTRSDLEQRAGAFREAIEAILALPDHWRQYLLSRRHPRQTICAVHRADTGSMAREAPFYEWQTTFCLWFAPRSTDTDSR
jgi:hypothetical protein